MTYGGNRVTATPGCFGDLLTFVVAILTIALTITAQCTTAHA
jgi:hypothetical protein